MAEIVASFVSVLVDLVLRGREIVASDDRTESQETGASECGSELGEGEQSCRNGLIGVVC